MFLSPDLQSPGRGGQEVTRQAGVSAKGSVEASESRPRGAAGDELETLRRLLLQPEQERIEQLSERLDDPRRHARDISQVLPEALRLSAQQGEQLTGALTPTVEAIIRTSVRRDSRTFADALYPVIGPAIRKAMAETLKQMLQSFGEMLDNSLSWQGLKWRLEAWRTGRPFAEVVMLHSLVFRVEQLFLIHRESGILLQHLAADDTDFQDADLVSGMLTAIQDFVRDSFDVSSDQTLDSIQVGDVTVWLESGPEAVLAVAIRGSAPAGLRRILREVLETLHLQQAEALRRFDGDPEAFASAAVREELGRCLQTRYRKPKRRLSPSLVGFLLVFLAGIGYWSFDVVREHLAFAGYLRRLEAEPGILVTGVEATGDGYRLRGLRDPLAADPASLVGGGILARRRMAFNFEPYEALTPGFVLARARRLLQPPETVHLSLVGGVLHLQGRAPYLWVEENRRLARALPGVTSVDTSGLKAEIDLSPLEAPKGVRLTYRDGLLTAIGSAPHAWVVRARRMATRIPGVKVYVDDGLVDQDRAMLRSLKAELEKEVVLFGVDTSRHEAMAGRFRDMATRIRRLLRRAEGLGRSVEIVLVGHTDTSGRDRGNLNLSQARADWVRFQLIAAGIDPRVLRTRAAGAREPVSLERTPQGMARNRSVTLDIHISEKSGAAP